MVMEKAWRRQNFHLWKAERTIQKLKQTAQAFKRWTKNHFGNASERIKYLETQLLQMQTGRDRICTLAVEKELREHRDMQESILHQKSRELWIQARDRNSKFFHASIVVRRRKNKEKDFHY